MLFTFRITAPANTPEASPIKAEMKLKAGVITKINVMIPPGHWALAHLSIRHGETQVIPWGDGQYIEGDDEAMVWEEDYKLPYEPVALTAIAWNEDDTYPHTYYIRIWIEDETRKLPVGLFEETLPLIRDFMRRVIGVE